VERAAEADTGERTVTASSKAQRERRTCNLPETAEIRVAENHPDHAHSKEIVITDNTN
jgi:hypothetical protein